MSQDERELKIEGQPQQRAGCLHCAIMMQIAMLQQMGVAMETADIINALAEALADVSLIASPVEKLRDDKAAEERAASVVALVKYHFDRSQSRESREQRLADTLDASEAAGRA